MDDNSGVITDIEEMSLIRIILEPVYREGFAGYLFGEITCPHNAGSLAARFWNEGYQDAQAQAVAEGLI